MFSKKQHASTDGARAVHFRIEMHTGLPRKELNRVGHSMKFHWTGICGRVRIDQRLDSLAKHHYNNRHLGISLNIK
jgi:hypothetical protein